jgi:uncharacterized protein YndB with AHSA1/START domain
MTESTDNTRGIEREFFIHADPKRVFEAFTEAQHIMRWFAPIARSEPGVGGFINLRWDQGTFSHDCEILEWEEGEHLLMTWHAGPSGETNLPVELRLEARDGGTLLRLVQSGFGSGESWDDEYESHARGWSYELRSLKYYVEAQFGNTRRYLLRRIPLSGDLRAAWTAIIGREGTFAFNQAELTEGDRFELRLPGGERTAAQLMLELAGQDFAAFADVLQGGLFRFALETFAGQPEIWIWAFSWHLAERELETLVKPWFDDAVERLASLQETA